jgi:tRNA(Arg) A34 adenosine deaminase TadA
MQTLDQAVTEQLVRRAIEIAGAARAAGNHPFGALVADASGRILVEAGNTVADDRDPTAHAETNVVRRACAAFDRATLADAVLVTSTEPCPMCTGAIFWSGIGTVVFALGEAAFYELVEDELPGGDRLLVPAADILRHGSHPVEVIGPVLEAEARVPHQGYWRTLA